MRKIIAILLAVMLIASMTIPAYAVTPKWEYKAVKLPEIKVSIKIPDSVFDNWFKEHPLNIKIDFTNVKLG
jgi:hypothetical protein